MYGNWIEHPGDRSNFISLLWQIRHPTLGGGITLNLNLFGSHHVDEQRRRIRQMTIDAKTRKSIAEAVAGALIGHAEELTELDAAIGDGDHGYNMKRGMEAILSASDALADKPSGEALKAAGMQLVMKVGGASGPLYGTLLMGLGKNLPDQPTADDLTASFGEAVDAVKARGKSDVGQKTMLDVLVPVLEAMRGGAGPEEIVKVAADARAATVPMQARRGRASFLGERSIGHVDPGARSSELMIAAAASVLGGLS